MFDFYKQENDQIVALKKLQVVTYQDMFDDGLAEIVDDKLVTFGFITFRVPKGNSYEEYKLELPLEITINAANIYKEESAYFIDFEVNDVIIDQTTYLVSAPIGSKNANDFLTLLIGGKIVPDRLEDLVEMFKENTILNQTTLRVQSALIEAMVSELARYKDNEMVPFRIATKNPKVNLEKDFVMVNIKDVARLSSVFNAISFEDTKKSLESAVLMTKRNDSQSISPVEAVLKF